MPTKFVFANFFATELEEGISAGALEMMVPPAAAAQLPVLDVDEEIRLVLWDGQQSPEIVGVTANPQSGVLTITRGKETTVGKAWQAGTQVRCGLTAEIINSALTAYFDINDVLAANFLPLAGGTLTGPLTLSGAPTDNLHAATKAYADTIGTGKLDRTGGTMTGAINMNTNRILALPTPVSSGEPATKGYADDANAVLSKLNTDDTALTTTGSASAYTVITATNYSDLADGIRLTIVPHTTNDAGPTFSPDGLTAKPLRVKSGATLQAGVLEPLVPIRVTYSLSEDCWFIHGALATTTAVRVGDFKWSDIETDHDRWLLCDGRAVSRTTYARLFAQLGTKYGVGDGSTTFNLPLANGRTLVARDNQGGTAADVGQVSTTITTTQTSNSATVASATGLFRGMYIVSANIPANTTITDISGTTITMSNAATDTAAGTAARFSPYKDAQVTGSLGGAIGVALTDPDELAQHNHGVTDPGHTHAEGVPSGTNTGQAGPNPRGGPTTSSTTGSSTTGITINNTGSSQAHGNTPPGMISNLFVFS